MGFFLLLYGLALGSNRLALGSNRLAPGSIGLTGWAIRLIHVRVLGVIIVLVLVICVTILRVQPDHLVLAHQLPDVACVNCLLLRDLAFGAGAIQVVVGME
jgi:hypothetical protein